MQLCSPPTRFNDPAAVCPCHNNVTPSKRCQEGEGTLQAGHGVVRMDNLRSARTTYGARSWLSILLLSSGKYSASRLSGSTSLDRPHWLHHGRVGWRTIVFVCLQEVIAEQRNQQFVSGRKDGDNESDLGLVKFSFWSFAFYLC